MAKAFIVDEEKCPAVLDGPAKRCAKIILDQMIIAHRFEGVCVHEIVAQEFVSGAVELVRPTPSHDVDLSAAGTSHFCGITACLHFELLTCVRGRTQV